MSENPSAKSTGIEVSIRPVTATSDSRVVQTPRAGKNNILYSSDGETNSLTRVSRKVTERAREIVGSVDNPEQLEYACDILDKIESAAQGYEDIGLPYVDALVSEEGEIALGWRIADTILAISIPIDLNDANWALISGLEDKGIKASGYFRAFENNLLMAWIVWLLEKLKTRQD